MKYTDDPKTCMDKLYAAFNPTIDEAKQLVEKCKQQRVCGTASKISAVKEGFVLEAMKIARFNNIATEPSGMAGLALFLSKCDSIPRDSRVLVVNTGWMYLPTRAT